MQIGANDLFQRITKRQDKFTKAEKKVAAFIVENPNEAMYLSISSLAQRCGVGDASVFRFCKTLEFSGYQQFKMSLAQSNSTENDVGGVTLLKEVKINDTIMESSSKLLNIHLAALNETYELLDEAVIKKAVAMLKNAAGIHFYGVGASGVSALEAKVRFARVTSKVFFDPDSHMQAIDASLLSEDDVAVVFSYSGATKDSMRVMEMASGNNAKTICITRNAKSPCADYADLVLVCGSNEGPFQGGSISAKIAQVFLIDILYTEYFKQNYFVCDKSRKSTTNAISDKIM